MKYYSQKCIIKSINGQYERWATKIVSEPFIVLVVKLKIIKPSKYL